MGRESILSELVAEGVVAILRTEDPNSLLRAVEALRAGGIMVFEVTMTVPGALQLIHDLRERFPSEIIIGAGTVLDGETARAAVLAGAEFMVSPGLSRRVITVAHRYSKLAIPGAFTPTEILTAWDAGADIVKVFPIRSVGPQYLRDVLGPLPQVRLMPTGGVTVENAADFIHAGAAAVGLGGELLDKSLIAAGRFDELSARARRLVELVRMERSTPRVDKAPR